MSQKSQCAKGPRYAPFYRVSPIQARSSNSHDKRSPSSPGVLLVAAWGSSPSESTGGMAHLLATVGLWVSGSIMRP